MMADQGFALPNSSYKELIKIIQGYGRVPENSVPADIGKVTGINETIISSNNAFLKGIGIIQGGKKKTTTQVGKSLAAAYDYEREAEVGGIWRSIVETNDFLQKVVAAVRIRKGMDESSLQAHVAYSAGQPKSPRVLTGAGTVVEILKVAGLLRDEAGNLVAAPEALQPQEIVEQRLILNDATHHDLNSANVIIPSVTWQSTPAVRLNIDVRVQCNPEQLEGLGEKLRKLLQEFNQQESKKNEKTVPPASGTTPESE
jgi:hypothetical protein